ncbi:MAG: tannase/feruloyl esterase family alpha/beta hydrolase [Acidobacteriaceae bacterium]
MTGCLFISGCGLGGVQAPLALSYNAVTAVYTLGVVIAPNSPTSTGGMITAFSVSPALPAGLSLSPSTGIISGTPTLVSAESRYTVTASNASGSATSALFITVNDRPPTSLVYASQTAVYAIHMPIQPNSPTSAGGAITSYSVAPTLPPGLSLNTTTGVIGGIPTLATAQADYVVTASDSGGSANATLNLTTAKIVPLAPAISCSQLLSMDFPNTQIVEATYIPANSVISSSVPSAGYLPAHCLVRGIVGARTGAPAPAMDQWGNLNGSVQPDAEYGIEFELRMPTATWNGDFFFTGGSGNDGVVAEAVGATLGGGTAYQPALYQGFAVVTQNSGHSSGTAADEFGSGPDQNNGFGYDPAARNDYGFQQTGTLTPIAKSIVAAFYGIAPVYSYYLGCSNGGREAMVASQQWGDMFDGVVAGDPGFRLPHAAIAEAWDTQQFASAAQAVANGQDPPDGNGNPSLTLAATPADMALVGNLVLQQCDALDGLVDGMIFNTDACRKAFDPTTITQLQCPTGTKAPGCLLPAQIAAIQKVFQGPVDSHGVALYSAWPYDVGIQDPKWMMWPIGANLPYMLGSNLISVPFIAQNITQGATSAMYLFTTPPDPAMNVFSVSMDDLNAGVNATSTTFPQSAVDYMEATSTNLSKLLGHNGKIIYFHGESDPVFSMYDTVQYYNNLTTAYGTSTPGFARLFLVPGMNHCSGGLHTLDSFDPLTAIVDWVEQGTAPASMIARNSNKGLPPADVSSFTVLPLTRSRPLCPYPQYAAYTGGAGGDPEVAASFTCVSPGASVPASKGTSGLHR